MHVYTIEGGKIQEHKRHLKSFTSPFYFYNSVFFHLQPFVHLNQQNHHLPEGYEMFNLEFAACLVEDANEARLVLFIFSQLFVNHSGQSRLYLLQQTPTFNLRATEVTIITVAVSVLVSRAKVFSLERPRSPKRVVSLTYEMETIVPKKRTVATLSEQIRMTLFVNWV